MLARNFVKQSQRELCKFVDDGEYPEGLEEELQRLTHREINMLLGRPIQEIHAYVKLRRAMNDKSGGHMIPSKSNAASHEYLAKISADPLDHAVLDENEMRMLDGESEDFVRAYVRQRDAVRRRSQP